MPANNEFLDSSLKNNRAEFTIGEVLTALIMISQESMGRYKLQNELGLTESNTKSLLNYCKKENLLEATRGRGGHSLTLKGEKIISKIDEYIIDQGSFNYQVFTQKYHYYIQISPDKRIDIQSWKIRDIAISYGGEAALILYVNENGSLYFPEKDLELDHFYPDLAKKAHELFTTKLQKNSLILIVSAQELTTARKSAIMTGMHLSEELLLILKTYA